jgi:predicted nucleic acid-binding protein
VRVALDTNILAYAEGVNGPERQAQARQILRDLAEQERVVPVQALGELFTLLTRKARRTAPEARAAVMGWRDACVTIDTTSSVLVDAMELATLHQLALWDSIMLAAAAVAGCRTLLSEDMQDGFTWRGVMVCNPFNATS